MSIVSTPFRESYQSYIESSIGHRNPHQYDSRPLPSSPQLWTISELNSHAQVEETLTVCFWTSAWTV